MPSQVFDQLLFAFVAHNFGVDELFYLYNSYQEPPGFNKFYQKYLRLEPRSLVKAVIRPGDLVSIKPLKRQKNASLQSRARHFHGSFGEITRFNSGDFVRNNSRNQPEFAIQLLMRKDLKLGLRPKYFCKITKIYVHRITKEVVFNELVKLRAIWNDKHNEVLYLPFAKDEGDQTVFWPKGIKRMAFVNALLIELHCKDPAKIMMDVTVSSFFPITRGDAEYLQRSGILDNAVASMPFDAFLEQKIWYPVIERMKMNSSQTEMEFIEGLEGMINLYSANIQNISEEASMRSYLTASVQFYEFCWAWSQKIKGDFKRNIALYAKILDLIREQMNEMMRLIGELHHPSLYELFMKARTRNHSNPHQIHQRMAALQQLAVIRHYLKANANGHDLHVICYGSQEHGFLQSSSLRNALAEYINFECDINNLNVSTIMANEILSETSVGRVGL